MFLDDLQKISCVFKSGKDLAFADDNIFLEVVRCLIGDTEVFHISWHLDFEFLADVKKMIYCVTTCEDDCCVLKNINLLLSEFFYWHRLYLNEWSEIYLQPKFFCKLKVW